MMKLVGEDLYWDLPGTGGFLDVIMVIFAWILWYERVHKNENYFDSDLEFCTISLLDMLKY